MGTVENYDPKALDGYNYKYEGGRFRRFLWFCAGTDVQLLKRCPHSERVKAEGIGGVVLATAGLAFLSGSYAFYTVFGPKVGYALTPEQQTLDMFSLMLASICGLAWALVIFNLDRFIVTSTGHGDGTEAITKEELKNGLPRIIMAVFIGICLSAPLEIRVFKSEIDAELEVQQLVQTKKLDADLEEQFNTNNTNLIKKKAEIREALIKKETYLNELRSGVRQQRKDLEEEAAGNKKSGSAGRGPAWRDRQANLEKMEAEISSEGPRTEKDIELLKKEGAVVQQKIDEQIALKDLKHLENKRRAVNIDGLGRRIQIAHDLFPIASTLLMLLLIIIEVTPIFIKMMFVRGPYDLLVENQNRIVSSKHGIEEYPIVQAGKNSSPIGVVDPKFHQAKVIEDFEIASLNAEKELSKVAHEAFMRRMKKDINTNPEKYFSENI